MERSGHSSAYNIEMIFGYAYSTGETRPRSTTQTPSRTWKFSRVAFLDPRHKSLIFQLTFHRRTCVYPERPPSRKSIQLPRNDVRITRLHASSPAAANAKASRRLCRCRFLNNPGVLWGIACSNNDSCD